MLFRSAIDRFFERQVSEGEDSGSALDRMSREIKGSIFTLLALFLLVALTSYIPIDTFNILQGHLDHMNNLGGIVGAMVSEWFLGTVGAPGYACIAITIWLAIAAFRGDAFVRHWPRLVAAVIGTILAAIACHLLLLERVPEASLLQGGQVGRVAGDFLRQYFNTTGAMLLVGGSFVLTLIITTGLSITRGFDLLFRGGTGDADEAASRPKPTVIYASGAATEKAAAPKPPEKKKSSRKKKKVDGDPLDEGTGEISLDPLADENAAEEEIPTGPYEFEEMIPFEGSYDTPTTRLLSNIPSDAKKLSRGELKQNANRICEHLLSFQITGQITDITQGPVLTTYEFKPSAGVKLSKIEAVQDDLGIVMGSGGLRIIAPIPGKTVVGIEVPRAKAEVIALKDLLNEKGFQDKKLRLPIALGKATDGTPLFGDMAAMPHLLVAGGTGSGKSVFVNSLIMSFLFRLSPKELRLILVDPKMLELNVFDGLPHLITNVITDNNIAFNALTWAVMEMDRRYGLMAESGSKNIDSFNSKQRGNGKLPFIVIVVDELADLMMSGGKMTEIAITRLAQKARAAGIHLVIATQRPSTDVVTGLIKANMPSRIAFKVPSGIDSRTVLDASGAESLMGRGDGMMMSAGSGLKRLHGTFVTEEDLARVVKYAKGGKDHTKNYIKFPATPPSKD